MIAIPNEKPKASLKQLLDWIREANVLPPDWNGEWNWDDYPIAVVHIRGYYANSIGVKDKNDFNVYDDATFIMAKWPFEKRPELGDDQIIFHAFNSNCDPQRRVQNAPRLKVGFHDAYRLDLHSRRYLALCQRLAPVTVQRWDQTKKQYFEMTGMFGINTHSGGETAVNSEGCCTIEPYQYVEFIYHLMIMDRDFGRKDHAIPIVMLQHAD